MARFAPVTTLAPPTPVAGAPCSTCGWPLVSERNATPWCPQCGWNIDYYEPSRRPADMRWKWSDRLSFRTAYDLNARQFADLSGRPVGKPGVSWSSVALTAIALTLLAFVSGLAFGGVFLLVGVRSGIADVVGVIAIAIAIALRPRFGKLGRYDIPVAPADMPHLSRLIGAVATATGAPMPHTLLFTTTFNAASGAYGLRRRRFISIGLPLWLSLTPQEQVALLGHELGHFVNGDVRRGPLTWFAFQFFANLVLLSTPTRSASRYRGSALAFGELFSQWVLWIFRWFFALCHLAVDALGMRASHHAEYAADALAARVGGSAAATTMLDALQLGAPSVRTLRRSVRNDATPATWRSDLLAGRAEFAAQMGNLRQLSMRDEASLFRSHPPAGLRARLIESQPQQSAAIVISERDAAEIDAELAREYRSLRTTFANS
jgi:heat shock protein HtpX